MAIERTKVNDPRRPTRTYYLCDKCRRRVTMSSYCYGCEMYVCLDCDETEVIGPHEFADHFKQRRKGVDHE